MKSIQLRLEGTRPLICHNSRLANPLDPIVKEIAKITAKPTKKRTDEDWARLIELEAYGGCYETDDGLLGFPDGNVWRCLYDGATAFKLGKDVQRAVIPDADRVNPIEVDSATVRVEDFLAQKGSIDFRSVASNGRNRNMRARPIIRNWAVTAGPFDLLTDVLDLDDLDLILTRSHRLVGLGDWRPRYGTFEYEIIEL